MKGIPYDGNDPEYFDLYHRKAAPNDHGWLTINTEWQHEWYYSIRELIDKYHPDLLYSDSALPFGNVGRSLIAHFYNDNMAQHKGHWKRSIPAKNLRKEDLYKMLSEE